MTGRPLTSTDCALNCSIHVFQITRNSKGSLVPKQIVNNDTSHLKMEGFISKRSVLPNSMSVSPAINENSIMTQKQKVTESQISG